MNCICGAPIQLNFPVVIIGVTPLYTYLVQIPCKCGLNITMQLDTMKPYPADRSEVFPPLRGEYQVAKNSNVNFTCPICRSIIGLKPSSVHKIDDAGKVTPSIVCPNGCGFHAWVALKNWKAS